MKKKNLLVAILSIGILYSCKDELPGFNTPLEVSPKHLEFDNQRDTAIITVQSTNFRIGHMEAKYISPTEDTLFDGWIKVVTLPKMKEVKVIVYDNDTGYGRYYIAKISEINSEASITIFQSAK